MEKTKWDAKDPLVRAKGESRTANQALRDYALMGPGRSLRSLHERYKSQSADAGQTEKPPTTSWGTLSGWSCRHDWVARVEAWTKIQNEREEAEWAARRREIRQREWDVSTKLLKRAQEMLETSIHKEVDDDGQLVIIPADWAWRDISKMLETSSKLSRLAADMETDRTEVNIPQITHIVAKPPGGEDPEPEDE